MKMSEKVTYVRNQLVEDFEEEENMPWFGLSDEQLKYTGHTDIDHSNLERVREADYDGLAGNPRDDLRFIKAMERKAESRKRVEHCISDHKKSGVKTWAQVIDVYEYWGSSRESFFPIFPDYHNPEWRDILDLNQVPLNMPDGKKVKGNPKYQQETRDYPLYKDILIRLRNDDVWSVRVYPREERNMHAYWIYAEEGKRLVIGVYYSKNFKQYKVDGYANDGLLDKWLASHPASPQVRAKYPVYKLSGWNFNIVTSDYYMKESKLNPFFVDEYNFFSHVYKMCLASEELDEYKNLQEIRIPAETKRMIYAIQSAIDEERGL